MREVVACFMPFMFFVVRRLGLLGDLGVLVVQSGRSGL
jgi:hypothetical protein